MTGSRLAGSRTAHEMALNGCGVLLIEVKGYSRFRKQCGGLFSRQDTDGFIKMICGKKAL